MKLRSPAPPCGLLLALAAVLLPTGAQAQSNRGGLFSSVGLTSDYRYQGVSNSDGNPALQGYVHWWRPDGFYAGLFATQVDFDDPGDTSYELDLYGGKNFDLKDGKTRLTAEAMFTAFPNEHVWGPTYNFIQFKAAARRTEGPWVLTTTGSFVPEASYGAGEAGGWRAKPPTPCGRTCPSRPGSAAGGSSAATTAPIGTSARRRPGSSCLSICATRTPISPPPSAASPTGASPA